MKAEIKVGTIIRAFSCDGVICVRIGGQAFYFEESEEALGAELEGTSESQLSSGARDYFENV